MGRYGGVVSVAPHPRRKAGNIRGVDVGVCLHKKDKDQS